jgi:hypothetical protein
MGRRELIAEIVELPSREAGMGTSAEVFPTIAADALLDEVDNAIRPTPDELEQADH